MFGRLSGFEGSLFDEFRRLEREMNQHGGAFWPDSIRAAVRGSYPPVNVGVTPEEVDVYLFAAGLILEQVDITIQQNLLTVEGERNVITEEGADYYRRERFTGRFRRVVTLPEDVDPDAVQATYRDGVLRVTVKRRESARPRQIEIR